MSRHRKGKPLYKFTDLDHAVIRLEAVWHVLSDELKAVLMEKEPVLYWAIQGVAARAQVELRGSL